MTNDNRTNSFLLIHCLDAVDKEKAVQVISDPELDTKELASVVEDSLMGNIVNKTENKTLHLSDEVMMAGFQNLINKAEKRLNDDLKSNQQTDQANS